MNLTWSKNTVSYLSPMEDNSSLMTSSSKSRRMKMNRYLFGWERRYGQLCKFRRRKRETKQSILLFESASLCARYMLGWCTCDSCVALYTLSNLSVPAWKILGKWPVVKCLAVLALWFSPRQWPYAVSHFI